ncbi:hypothetical protein [Streptococcus parasanguinis]|uniref:hypothetical protein n=1 Tax=Streptococcus parasanguinis TaxID=1318 RepID=UPI00319DF381
MNIGQEEKRSKKELARNVLCQYHSLCRIAGVDYLTGDLLDSCIDQQNQRQNMALTEVNRIRKAIEGISSATGKRILEMSFIGQKKVSTFEQMEILSISSSNYHRRKARALLEFIEQWQ